MVNLAAQVNFKQHKIHYSPEGIDDRLLIIKYITLNNTTS